jgi:hypothetical protein
MLQDMGLKQAEVAFFVRSCRNQLKQFATAPFFPAFLAFRLQEIREGHPLWHSWRGVIIRGAADALRADAAIDELKGLDGDGRVFLELGGIVSRLSDYLQQAPEIRRGRP